MNKKVLYVIIGILILILLAGFVLIYVMSNSEVGGNESENTVKETVVSEQSSEKADISLEEETLANDEGESIEPNDTKPMEDHTGTENVPVATEKETKPGVETTPAEDTEEETEEITTEETTSPTNPTLANDNENATSWG